MSSPKERLKNQNQRDYEEVKRLMSIHIWTAPLKELREIMAEVRLAIRARKIKYPEEVG